jgi:hypothetical protein
LNGLVLLFTIAVAHSLACPCLVFAPLSLPRRGSGGRLIVIGVGVGIGIDVGMSFKHVDSDTDSDSDPVGKSARSELFCGVLNQATGR